jgi:hypothetical protein
MMLVWEIQLSETGRDDWVQIIHDYNDVTYSIETGRAVAHNHEKSS